MKRALGKFKLDGHLKTCCRRSSAIKIIMKEREREKANFYDPHFIEPKLVTADCNLTGIGNEL